MRGGLCASMPMSLLACDQVAKLCLSWHLTSLSTSIQSMGSVYSMYRLFTSAVDIIDNIEVSSDSEVSSEHLVEQDVYDEDNFYYGSALCVAKGKGKGCAPKGEGKGCEPKGKGKGCELKGKGKGIGKGKPPLCADFHCNGRGTQNVNGLGYCAICWR